MEVTLLFYEFLFFRSVHSALEDETSLLSRNSVGHVSHNNATLTSQRNGDVTTVHTSSYKVPVVLALF